MSISDYTSQCIDTIMPYILGEAGSCSYCDHLTPLILQEGSHTYITLAIGQIVEGYLQVCAQEHRVSSAGLQDYEVNELIVMKKIVRGAFKEIYGTNGIAFEHGRAGSCLWKTNQDDYLNSLCHHAHIHFVPVEVDIREQIRNYIPEEITIHNVYDLQKFRKQILKEDSYLYFEDMNEIGYVYPVQDRTIPRQFLRTCVATALGVPERANWETYIGEKYFQIGKSKLQPIIRKLYEEYQL